MNKRVRHYFPGFVVFNEIAPRKPDTFWHKSPFMVKLEITLLVRKSPFVVVQVVTKTMFSHEPLGFTGVLARKPLIFTLFQGFPVKSRIRAKT